MTKRDFQAMEYVQEASGGMTEDQGGVYTKDPGELKDFTHYWLKLGSVRTHRYIGRHVIEEFWTLHGHSGRFTTSELKEMGYTFGDEAVESTAEAAELRAEVGRLKKIAADAVVEGATEGTWKATQYQTGLVDVVSPCGVIPVVCRQGFDDQCVPSETHFANAKQMAAAVNAIRQIAATASVRETEEPRS